MREWVLPITILLLAIGTAVPAVAQPAKGAGGHGQEMFKKADVNADGKLSIEEVTAIRPHMTKERFEAADKNKDGFLSPDECRTLERQGMAGLLRKADANKDQKVTEEELKTVMPKLTSERFAKMDRNHDGVITKEDTPRPASPPERPQHGPGGRVAALAKDADANNDGKVTLEELKAKDPNMTPELFAKMDKNKDGVLSADDRPQGKPQGSPEGDGQDNLPEMIKKSDSNGDGKVTYDEIKAKFPKMPKERFEKLDRNNDGVLSEADRAPAV